MIAYNACTVKRVLWNTGRFFCFFALGFAPFISVAQQPGQAVVSGEQMLYHPIRLTFEGPEASETGAPNPFRDYRLNVTFRHEETGDELVAPGYFAADGNAADTGADSGNRWRAHFTPHRTGTWTWQASFRAGTDVALRLDPLAGEPASFDGAQGAFAVSGTDKTGRDFRGKGMLRYVGDHYLRFDDGSPFLKGGADSPETLLAYVDFDGASVHAGDVPLKTWEAHIGDWNEGDPVWRDGKGKGLVGALNYLASEGLNAVSFLPMNVEGDGRNVWPWIRHDARDRYDVSKLAQWERVFAHADSLGLYLHFKTQETENDLLLDGGELGPERKLYYRELAARFGHHLALNWNLGEENDIWEELDDPEQRRIRSYAEYIRALDPYDHPIVMHTYPDQQTEAYTPLLGDASGLAGISLQTHWDRVHEHTLLWRRASAEAGKKWVVANDEQGDAQTGVMPDGPENNHDDIRRRVIWGHLMAGGAGLEFYFGYEHAHNDLDLEDFRSRDRFWDYVRHALHFFNARLPYWEMTPDDGLAPGDRYALAKPGEIYAVYVPEGSPDEEVLLQVLPGLYLVHWYDPAEGGAPQTSGVAQSAEEGVVSIGAPPSGPDGKDWVALVQVAEVRIEESE